MPTLDPGPQNKVNCIYSSRGHFHVKQTNYTPMILERKNFKKLYIETVYSMQCITVLLWLAMRRATGHYLNKLEYPRHEDI